MILNFLAGVVNPSCTCIPRQTGACAGETPGGRLLTFAWCGLAVGILTLYIGVRMLAIMPILEAAAAITDEREKEEMLRPAMPVIAPVRVRRLLLPRPVVLFWFFWWIKGNFDVWGTFPRDDFTAVAAGQIHFEGCDRALLEGGRRVMLLSYALIVLSCRPFARCAARWAR